ncbi:hypothetical protein FRC17_002483 [Serendipita sp. 399]|nr:hypothetical protein FRC17_002483 [Serendipita sp. 399]
MTTQTDEASRLGEESEITSNNVQSVGRSLPERSRTLSSSELDREKSSKHGASQFAPNTSGSTTTGGMNGASSMPLKAGSFATSRSEDGHSSSIRGPISDPAQLPLPPSLNQTICDACGNVVTGQFVRALGVVFHKACFTCRDCKSPVAQKFFPVDGPDGRPYPLCETDYFRRLGLLCANCGLAMRGSYITACNKKYHIEHFICSIPTCTTLFGPSDSYYEHEDSVYCHFHYSTRFANKCAGCNTAILKQFVEVNRNMKEDCYHPECYLCHKFWNVKLYAGIRPNSSAIENEPFEDLEPRWAEEERTETAQSIRAKQNRMEQQVNSIWTILSSFEESSASCISDMLKHVSDGHYLNAIRDAEKFILHVEVLFAAIDDLEYCFAARRLKGMSHVREARVLCKKTVDLFTLLQKPNKHQGGMTQELLSLVTGLAHYLKVLIRIALTAALKLDREHGKEDSIPLFLDSLNALLVHRGSTATRRIMERPVPIDKDHPGGVAGTYGVVFGYKSLTPEYAGESPFWPLPNGRPPPSTPLSESCIACNAIIEEDCVRLGTYQRWHAHCVTCRQCGKAAGEPLPPPKPRTAEEKEAGVRPSTVRRPPALTDDFVFDLQDGSGPPPQPAGSILERAELITEAPIAIWCLDHRRNYSLSGLRPVTRLEQYSYLLNVALRKLYILLKKPGIIPEIPTATEAERQARRESSEITPLRAVHHLDRKLSATSKIPKRSTIIESAAGGFPQSAISSTPRPEAQKETQTEPQTSGSRGPPFLPVRQQSLQAGATPAAGQSPSSPQTSHGFPYSQPHRPSIPHTNTQVHITEHSAPPQSPSYIPRDPNAEDGITLADIPQFIEATQNRSLPGLRGRPHITELSPQELLLVKYAALLIIAKSPIGDPALVEEMIDFLDMKKGGFWNKLFNKGDKKNFKKKGVFCVPLELLAEREGVDSMLGVASVPLRVPSFIDDIVSAMKQMDMSVEGIFRKNGNIRRMNQVIESLDRDPGSVDLSQDNPVQLAALLKRFLRDLPDPLLTYKLHRLWIMTQSIHDAEERGRLLHMVMLLLPRYHRDTLEVLLVFLKWVASFSHVDEETGSKMDLGNLATVITPSILKANKRDGVRDESFPGIRVVTELLEGQDELYLVPQDFIPLIQEQNYFTTTQEQPRELLKKIDTFLRLRHGSNASAAFPGMRPPAPSGLASSYHSGPSSYSNGSNSDRPGPVAHATDYNFKSLPPHPGLPHQPFSSPTPTSRIHSPDPRPSLDELWAPPSIPSSDSRRDSPRSRPNSFLRPSNDMGPPIGSLPSSRNSPLA